VPVQVCGVVVHCGDLLHGDENGLLLVPGGVEAKLPAAVDAVRARERRLMDWIRSEAFSLAQLEDRMLDRQ
jgi:regulator of RNase E activity RraA